MIRHLCCHVLALIIGLAGSSLMAAPQPGEYQIKAAYLINFARYMEWPAGRLPAGAVLRLCLLGRDPFGGSLLALEGRPVQGREVRFRQADSLDQALECHIVFVSGSEERRLGLILRGLSGRGVLSVSDIEGFAEAGGGIGMVTEDDRVRFDINQAALTRDGLRASSQLLRLGRQVFGTERGPR